jgi:hypothetical protein
MNIAPDFCMYMPNNELAGIACFDFVGVLKEFKPVTALEDNSVEGYMLLVQLINEPDDPMFFTVEMFVNKNNMRFTILEKNQKLTGCFMLQGQIKN